MVNEKTSTKRPAPSARGRILAGAIHEFIADGFHGARMQRIADRAGVNKALLFYYFSSKEQIYREALSVVFSAVFAGLGALGDEEVPVEKKVRQIVDVYYTVFARYPEYVRLVQYELLSGGERLKELLGPRKIPLAPGSGIYRYFHRQMKAGKIERSNVVQLLLSILGQVLFPIVARPMIETLLPGMAFEEFLKKRREYVVRFTLRAIKKKDP